jgi:hypothetical protein
VLRQDVWKGNPLSLCGFQTSIDSNEVNLTLWEFLADPTRAIGMYPVFFSKGDSMFTLRNTIESVWATSPGEEPRL